MKKPGINHPKPQTHRADTHKRGEKRVLTRWSGWREVLGVICGRRIAARVKKKLTRWERDLL